ncbi:MAG TPA: SH3 domain-containing protein [Bradyrhizobium sp.]|nr:SH3 domain-containing protein [Bradyrhizobium sp.]
MPPAPAATPPAPAAKATPPASTPPSGGRLATVYSTVNLREGAGTTHSVVAKIPAGSRINVASCSGQWCQASWEGKDGYVVATSLTRHSPQVYRGPQVYDAPAPGYVPPPVYAGPPDYYGPRPYYPRPYYYGYYGPGPYWYRPWRYW